MFQNTYSGNDPIFLQSDAQPNQFQENQINIYSPYEQNQIEYLNQNQNTEVNNYNDQFNQVYQVNEFNNSDNQNIIINGQTNPNQNLPVSNYDYNEIQNNNINNNIILTNQNVPINNIDNDINQNPEINNNNLTNPNNQTNNLVKLNTDINRNQIPKNNNIIINDIKNELNQNNQINNLNNNTYRNTVINKIPIPSIKTNEFSENNQINNLNNHAYRNTTNNHIPTNQNISFDNNNDNNQINGMENRIAPINNIIKNQSKLNEVIKPNIPYPKYENQRNPLNKQRNFSEIFPQSQQSFNYTSQYNQNTYKNSNENGNENKNQLDINNQILQKYNSSNKLNNTNKNQVNNNTKNNNNQNSNNNTIKKYKKNIQKIDQLKLNEAILLKNQKESLNKDLDLKTHFDIEVTKERFLFNYKKVLKIAMPLLSHYEMPSDCEYKFPLLSPDGSYLSCIARGTETDTVYVWDLDDLYWFKYKFSCSRTKIDCVAFTPDSKSILVIYKKTNPSLYNLITGKKSLELESIGEENKKESFHYAFTIRAAHFGYTTDNSFVLWSMKSGKIRIRIRDESPIKLLFNEYIISIKNDLYCEIRHLKTLNTYLSFKLKGIKNPNEILDVRISPNMSAFIYIIKQGVIKYIFKEKKFKGLQKFQPGVEKATISDDCRFVVKTNMRNLTIYDIEKGITIGTILKEKFNEFRIDFNNEKLIVIDNICINIHDYTDGGIPEKFVWLNKNPNRFLDVKFSHDFKFIFGLVDNNNVIGYDLNTGLIIKKWKNIDKNWTNFSISEMGNKIASNSNLFSVKIWNYITGREDSTFYGFDSHSFHFSSDGKYLACGAKNGPEVARIWDIAKGTFGSFPYVGNNSNFHTIVHLTSPEPTRLICCSIDQQPLIFDTNSKELLYKCECLYRFEEIYQINSDQVYDVFIVKGRDVKKRDIGLLYRISDGILLETYENYSILELAKDQGVIICKCDNVNDGKLTATDVKNLSDPILNDFQIQTDKIKLLNDNKCVVVVINEEEFRKEFCLLSADDGGYFGKINYSKKTDRNSECYITIDPMEEFIYFRYFEFLSPQESRNLKNKILFRNSQKY